MVPVCFVYALDKGMWCLFHSSISMSGVSSRTHSSCVRLLVMPWTYVTLVISMSGVSAAVKHIHHVWDYW